MAFTLIELLLVIGIIGVLSSVVIVAINPTKMLGMARDAARRSAMKQIQNAFEQYNINFGKYPGADQLPSTEAGAIRICRQGVTDPSCLDVTTALNPPLTPTFIVSIPQDPSESSTSIYSGYSAYKNSSNRIQISNVHLGEGMGAGGGAGNWLAGWSYRKKIQISGTNVAATLNDFPLYVKISGDSDIGGHVQNGGQDLRFTVSDGTTLLPYERESWTGGGGSAVTADIWVKVPTIAAGQTTDIYIYYGNAASPDGQDAQNVWDSGYGAVYHLAEATAPYRDSTRNGNNSTSTASTYPSQTNGITGKAQNFNGPNNISIPSSASINGGNGGFTFEMWTNISSPPVGYDIPLWKGGGGAPGYDFELGWLGMDLGDGIIPQSPYQLLGTQQYNQWMFYAGVVDRIAGYFIGYVNGVPSQPPGFSLTSPPFGSIDSSYPLQLSRDCCSFTGLLDEVRISKVARSATWLKFENYNMRGPSDELTWWTPEGR